MEGINMAEATTADTTNDAQETPVFPDPMSEMSFNMLSGLINDRNAEVGKINAVKGDRMTLTEQLEAASTNPEAVKARKAKEKAQADLDEAIMALHKVIQPEVDALLKDAESSVTQIEEQVKDLDSKIKPGLAYFKKMYGESLAKHLPAMGRLKGFSTRGAGSSGRRIRGYSVTVEIDGEDVTYENVASAAKYLDVETADLQAKFFEAAGNPEKLADAPNVVSFQVEFTETYDDNSTATKVATVTCIRDAKDDGAADDEGDEGDDTEATESE